MTTPIARQDPLLRFLALARPLRGRLLLAVLAGAATTAAGIGLLTVSELLVTGTKAPSSRAGAPQCSTGSRLLGALVDDVNHAFDVLYLVDERRDGGMVLRLP
jgi:hypothetical protein